MPKPEHAEHPDFYGYNICVVIPSYRVERQIHAVLQEIPDYIRHIILVDDASDDSTRPLVQARANQDHRISLLCHEQNQGVGGATVTGFRKAIELGAQIVVKLDGDGQMDVKHLPNLITPLLEGKADYTKGNRFRDFPALARMPLVRRVGNLFLGFLTKASTGYWNLFDPANGYVAIRAELLSELPLSKLDRTYYFETSMLANLYLLGAVVRDVAIPARYQEERSNLRISRVLLEFPLKLFSTFIKRILLKNFIYDFSMETIYILAGFPLLLFGLIFGTIKWIHYAMINVPAPTGTVILPTLSVLLGIQFLLSAVEIDLRSVPREPLSKPLV
jgi:glycosyltransferase involved in cell wall biosynthesis